MTYPQQQFPPPGGANPSGQAPYGRSPVQFPAPTPKPWHRRKEQAFVVPLIVVILGGLGTLLGMVIVLFRPVLISMIAVLVFSVVAALGFWFLRWLDRWEPEPPMFLIGAFLWGAGVSAFVSGIVNTVVLGSTGSFEATTRISAPLIEESTKALFLVVLLLSSKRARAEFNSLTDAIVYGGMVGLGFSWIENISYALGPETASESLQVLVIRLLLVAFLHPILTIIASIGIWFGFRARGAMRLVWPVAGWCLAVFLHWVHNSSYQLFGDTGSLVTAGIEVLVVTGLIVIGVLSRKGEQAAVRRQLPVLVHFGWITASEAGWLADLSSRKAVLSRTNGDERRALSEFIQNTTELALVRERLDADQSGRPPSELLQTHKQLVDLVVMRRTRAAQLLGQGGPWQPMPPRPGDNWGTMPYPG